MKALLTLLWLACAGSHAASTLTLGLGNQASPPYKLGDDTLPATRPGVAVALLQQAAARCDVQLHMTLLPGARMLKALENGELDAAGLLSYSPERAAYAAYPMHQSRPDENKRLATLSYVLYARRGHQLQWDGSTLQGLKRKVGTNTGWSINRDLEKLGIAAEPANSVTQNFMKLQAGRIDAYATHQALGDRYMAQHGNLPLVRLRPAIVSKPYYLIFSRRFASRHPTLANCMWQQIASQRDRFYHQHLPDYLD